MASPRRLVLLTIGVLAALLTLGTPGTAVADVRRTDQMPVTFASDEDNTDHHLFWNHFVHFQQFDQYDARTVLSVGELNRWAWNNDTDFIWFAGAVINNSNAEYMCRSVMSNGRCNRARVIFNEGLTRHPQMPANTGFFLACHEFGHGYGFDHNPTNETSCMNAPINPFAPPQGGFLTDFMVNQINSYPWG